MHTYIHLCIDCLIVKVFQKQFSTIAAAVVTAAAASTILPQQLEEKQKENK